MNIALVITPLRHIKVVLLGDVLWRKVLQAVLSKCLGYVLTQITPSAWWCEGLTRDQLRDTLPHLKAGFSAYAEAYIRDRAPMIQVDDTSRRCSQGKRLQAALSK